jgi:sigma-B regulation protein RsbU (phosphoserine phosphatase)
VAVYLDGVSAHFGFLRENLVLGCTAAFALLGAVIIIGLRFPNYMHGKHIEEELSLARRVQTDLFPVDTSMLSRLAFAAKCVPAWQVGGDLYDVFETDDGEVALVLGDVSGKGLPAALLMGVVQGAVRASCGTGAAQNHEQATRRLNELLCMKTARERFVSLFWCYADQRRGALHYVNAGHLPPLLVRDDGTGTKVIRLEEGGPVLGLLPDAQYRQASVEICPGDLLVLFSDGIPEAFNARDEEFGERRMIAAIERNLNRSPSDICAAILADVGAFLGTVLPHDDQTLLVVRLDEVRAGGELPVSIGAAVPALR